MKKLLYLLLAGIILSSCASFRKVADCSLTEDQMKTEPFTSKDQGDECIAEWNAKVMELNKKLQASTSAVNDVQSKLDAESATLKKCREDMYRLLGNITDADISDFGQRLGRLEGKVREMAQLPNDVLADKRAEVMALEAELNKMRGEKISVLPEFYDRIIALARDIKGLYREKTKKGGEYIVGTWAANRDCLWNISGKADIYGDPFQWPKIWQGNTDMIRNPDIIHPGQKLMIPAPGAKTSDEMKAERSYWRKKRAAEAKKAELAPASAPVEKAAAPAPVAEPSSPKGK